MKTLTFALAHVLGAGVAMTVASSPAFAQQAQRIEKIEVTGSNIKRVEGETALPVTVIRAEELREAGITSIEQVLTRIPQSQSTIGLSQGIGLSTGGQSEADLRGLGGNKTLVLLNGRRVANHAYAAGSVDLNAIPLAAIDRIEVLRDGASAIYGTDAIGGVINFIMKRDFTGLEVSGDYLDPESPGGREYRYSGIVGFGSLDKNRFNVMAVADYHKIEVLRSIDRNFAATGIRFERGLFNYSGTGFPANYTGFRPDGTNFTTNPFFPGCNPATGSVNLTPDVPGDVCRYDFTRSIDLIPETEQKSFVGRAAFAVSPNTTASLEYVWAESTTIARVAATPATGIPIPTNSPYYPGNGIIAAFPGMDRTQPVIAAWRTLPAGQRTSTPTLEAQRAVAEVQTNWNRWDLRGGLSWSKNETVEEFTNGYIRRPQILAGAAGTLSPGVFFNPFGDPTPEEAALLQTTKVLGPVIAAKGDVKGADVKGSVELGKIAGGPLALALGAETRKEKFSFDIIEENARAAQSSGLELATDVTGSRKVHAVFGELNVPFARNWEAQIALRHDRYSDVGNTTNPKVALRFQPTRELLLRASANSGFRAPTLYELLQPEQFTFSSDAYNDPVLCPGGVVTPSGNEGRDCGQQTQVRLAGNTVLEPEKSRTYALGVVMEPMPGLSIGLDYFRIKIRNTIAVLGEQTINNDPVTYAARFIRCSQLAPAIAATFDRCQIPGGDPIAYVDTPLENQGEIRTAGYDLDMSYRFPRTAFGQFTIGLQGTYLTKYEYQRERGGEFAQNVGLYSDASPIFRWQHVAFVNWRNGPWSATLNQRYKGGYEDQNFVDEEFLNRVDSYSVLDLAATYTGWRGLSVTAGIKNVIDEDPPFSNQGTTFQGGYDPRFADPIGRAYFVKLSYRFR